MLSVDEIRLHLQGSLPEQVVDDFLLPIIEFNGFLFQTVEQLERCCPCRPDVSIKRLQMLSWVTESLNPLRDVGQDLEIFSMRDSRDHLNLAQVEHYKRLIEAKKEIKPVILLRTNVRTDRHIILDGCHRLEALIDKKCHQADFLIGIEDK